MLMLMTAPRSSSTPIDPPRATKGPLRGPWSGLAWDYGRTQTVPADCLSPAEGHRPQADGGPALRPVTNGRGFTLVELMVTLTVLGILIAAAAPSFGAWVRNARVRTVSQALQDGVRLAQSEAIRRNRQVVFALTDDIPGNASAAAANGKNWAVHALPLTTSGDPVVFVQGGVLADVAANVAITGPGAICFNSAGRQVANAATGVVGAVCTVNAASPLVAYNVALANADRPLRVTVALGGQVRVCDPARVLSATAADGCPAP